MRNLGTKPGSEICVHGRVDFTTPPGSFGETFRRTRHPPNRPIFSNFRIFLSVLSIHPNGKLTNSNRFLFWRTSERLSFFQLFLCFSRGPVRLPELAFPPFAIQSKCTNSDVLCSRFSPAIPPRSAFPFFFLSRLRPPGSRLPPFSWIFLSFCCG